MRNQPWIPQLTKYVVFNTLGTLSYSCYALADTYFIAKAFGITGMTALNFAVAIMYVINGVSLMFAMGGAIKFAVSSKTHDRAQGDIVFSTSVGLCLIVGLLSLLAGIYLAEPIAIMMGANSDTMDYTVIYMRTLLCFGGAFFLNSTVTAFVRNDGAPRLAMTGMITGSFSNVLLDYIFIFKLHMGVFGGALASCIAPLISLTIQLSHFARKRNGVSFRLKAFRWNRCPAILSYGVSTLVTEGLPGLVLIITNHCLLSLLGNVGVAAFGVLTNTALVVTAVFTGIAQGIQPMASSAQSRDDGAMGKQVLRYAICAAALMSFLIYGLVFFFTGPIVQAFNSEHDLNMASLACRGLRLYFLGYLVAGFNIVVSAYLGAVAQPRPAFIIAIMRCGIVAIPVVLLLSSMLGVDGVWLSFPAAEAAVAVYSFLCARRIRQNSLQKPG